MPESGPTAAAWAVRGVLEGPENLSSSFWPMGWLGWVPHLWDRCEENETEAISVISVFVASTNFTVPAFQTERDYQQWGKIARNSSAHLISAHQGHAFDHVICDTEWRPWNSTLLPG